MIRSRLGGRRAGPPDRLGPRRAAGHDRRVRVAGQGRGHAPRAPAARPRRSPGPRRTRSASRDHASIGRPPRGISAFGTGGPCGHRRPAATTMATLGAFPSNSRAGATDPEEWPNDVGGTTTTPSRGAPRERARARWLRPCAGASGTCSPSGRCARSRRVRRVAAGRGAGGRPCLRGVSLYVGTSGLGVPGVAARLLPRGHPAVALPGHYAAYSARARSTRPTTGSSRRATVARWAATSRGVPVRAKAHRALDPRRVLPPGAGGGPPRAVPRRRLPRSGAAWAPSCSSSRRARERDDGGLERFLAACGGDPPPPSSSATSRGSTPRWRPASPRPAARCAWRDDRGGAAPPAGGPARLRPHARGALRAAARAAWRDLLEHEAADRPVYASRSTRGCPPGTPRGGGARGVAGRG